MHLRCRLTKNSPRRAKSTPAGVFCTLLASASPIFKSAGCKGISFVAAHKLILNVSEPPWTAVVSSRSQFASANWQPKNEQGCSFLGVPAVNLCSRLVSTPYIFKSVGYSTSALSLRRNKCSTYQNAQGRAWL